MPSAALVTALSNAGLFVTGANVIAAAIEAAVTAAQFQAQAVAYSVTVPLDTPGAGKVMPSTTLAANSTFLVGSGAVADGTCQVLLVSDGVHVPDLSNFTLLNGYAWPTAAGS